MKLRPTIFLSGVSHEFASFRDAVETEIQKKGCFPLNQPSFEPDYRTVEEMLRRRLSEADAVIHIAGFRFGAEPNQRPADRPRRSYTQMEFDIAREMQKPIYIFLSASPGLRDAPDDDEKPEDADVAELQSTHRELIRNGDHLYDFFKDKAELCQKVAQIPIVASTDFRVDIFRIDKYAPAELIGRDDELKLLNNAWLKVRRAESQRPHIITFVALGGEGKTSLVAKWLAEQAFQDWPGCEAAFAWSFYSQGTRDQAAGSSDLFLKEAITFFGNENDKEFAASNTGGYEKGQRLARIVGQRRSLLILDGLEPLQYAPTSPTPGELKDLGIAALLKGLAARSEGLCIVTTRYSLPDLKIFWQTTAPEEKLLRLSREAGSHLLWTLGVRGKSEEFERLVEDVKGHALTLSLLGTYLRDAHGGDLRRRDHVKLEEADAAEQGGHAFRVIAAYERALEDEGDEGKRALAVLRLLGLFDRPMSVDCLSALLQEPEIHGLTDPLVGLSSAQHNLVFKRLEDAKLITVNSARSGALTSIDGHPLLRQYFAAQMRAQCGDAWRIAHRRLYRHLSSKAPNKINPTLEDLQPLYQAVGHGCQSDLHQEVLDDICYPLIWRQDEFYTFAKLGAYGSDLGAIAHFFQQPWSRLLPAVKEWDYVTLLNNAAICLRALGRLIESLEPMRKGLEYSLEQQRWVPAARIAANLSELELTLGEVVQAEADAAESVTYADRGGNPEYFVITRTTHAYVLHQAGRRTEAEMLFEAAEKMHQENQLQFQTLYSLRGFLYCGVLLSDSEKAAWRKMLSTHRGEFCETSLRIERIRSVVERATRTLRWSDEKNLSILTPALDRLTLGRAGLFEAVLFEGGVVPNTTYSNALDSAVHEIRRAGTTHHLPRALLTRSWSRTLQGRQVGINSAQEDLDEAWELAERGPMRLFMADIHLYRARLFFREEKYPWASAQKDLEAAEKLINECGYHRRDEELADAKRVILGQSA